MRSVLSLSLFAAAASALTAAQWRSQSIYQIVTDRFANTAGTTTASCSYGSYCGGTWQGIINKLDYIQGMGFTAIWISPVVKNINGGTAYGDPYHGYWAQDLYSLNSAFGTPADLKALSAALHARGMYLMVDVAPNHFAYNGAPANVDYSKLNPFNDVSYYHPYCKTDYDNTTSIQQCWAGDTVVSLPDLRTETASVQSGMNTWIASLVANYSIDGLRLDSAMAVNQAFWPTFITASKVYAIGEVLDGNPTTFGAWQSYMPGMLNYPSYYWIIRAFQSTTATMTELSNNMQWLNTTVADNTLLGNFIENHDNPRFASYTTDVGLTSNAVAYTTFNDGIPIVYYGQEQGFSGVSDPYNREPLWPSTYTKTTMYKFIAKLNAVRNTVIYKDTTYASTKSKVMYNDAKVIITRKGSSSSPLYTMFNNYGTGGSASVTASGFLASTSFTDMLTCDTFTSTSAGKITLTVVNGAPRALYVSNNLMGSDLCAVAASSTSTAARTSTVGTTSSAAISSSVSSVPTTPSTTAVPTTIATSTKTSSTAPITTTAPTSSAVSTSAPVPSTSSSKTSASIASSTPVAITTTISSSTLVTTSSSSSASPSVTKVACPASNSTTFVVNSKSYIVECGIDHSAGDLSMVYVSNLTACITKCSTTTGCVGVSLSGTACYMKSKIGKAVYNGVLGARLLNDTATSTSSSAAASTSTKASSTSSACALATSVAVSFYANVTTAWLETVKIVGSVAQIGTWNTTLADQLSASTYTSTNTIWNDTISFAAGTYFEYKFIKVNSTSAAVTWESGNNRNFTVPSTCATTAIVNGTWQG